MREIPKQFQKEDIRFNVLRKKGKEAIEKGWNKDKNYKFSDKQLDLYLKRGHNYGVICGFGGLLGLDADTQEIEAIAEKLPKTFTVKTGRGRKHYYFYCKDLDKPIRLTKDKAGDLGDVQYTGKYLVGANSIHPNGNKYEVFKDVPIATIAAQELKFALRDYIITEDINVKQEETRLSGTELNISDVANNIVGLKRRGNSLYGSHPIHSSDTGMNFWIDTSKGVWHCFRCDSGGGAFSLIAVLEGLITCQEAQKGVLRGEKFKKVLEIARDKYGLVVSKKVSMVAGDSYSELREKVYRLLLQKDRRKATELLVRTIKKEHIIYTISNDEVTEMWIYSDGIYIPQAKTIIRKFCRKILLEAYTKYLGAEVIDKIATDTYIDGKDFFDKEILEEIALQNGILNIFTKELSNFTPKKIFFSKLPVIFDHSKKCPNIEKHFDAVLKNPETDKKGLIELFGYLLLKEYRIEKGFMFSGDGRNGKGKTLSLMKRFIGEENCVSRSIQQLEEETFAIGDLFKKLANLCGDMNKRALKSSSNFKQLRGRDIITASRKFKPPVKYTNYAKLIFCANEFPITYDETDAFWNSWVVFDFPYKFVSQKEFDSLEDKTKCKIADNNILNKIATPNELSGLLNLALDGLKDLIKNEDFSYSQTAEDIKNIWLRRSSSLNAFLLDEIKEEWDGIISKNEFRRAYSNYCKTYKLNSVSDKILKELLSRKGVSDDRKVDENSKQVSVWSGIEFSKGSKDSNGFSTYTLLKKRAKVKKTISNLTNLTKNILNFIKKKKGTATVLDIELQYREYKEEEIDKLINDLLKNGEIFENPKTKKLESNYGVDPIK